MIYFTAVSVSGQPRITGWLMSNDLQSIWKEAIVAKSMYCAGGFQQEMKKTTNVLSQNDRCLCLDPKGTARKYETRALLLH